MMTRRFRLSLTLQEVNEEGYPVSSLISGIRLVKNEDKLFTNLSLCAFLCSEAVEIVQDVFDRYLKDGK